MSPAACGTAAQAVSSWTGAAEEQSPWVSGGSCSSLSVLTYFTSSLLSLGTSPVSAVFSIRDASAFPSVPSFQSELNCSQCHTRSCWIIKSSRFAVHRTSLIHLLEEHSYMAKCTCCSCWQSVADQNLMVHTFVVTIKKFISRWIACRAASFAPVPRGTVGKTLFNSEYLKGRELKDYYATLASTC